MGPDSPARNPKEPLVATDPKTHLTELAAAAADTPADNPLHQLYHEAIDNNLDLMEYNGELSDD